MENNKLISDVTSTDKSVRRGFLKKLGGVLAGATLLSALTKTEAKTDGEKSTLGDSPFVGEISICAYNFAPQGWAFCNGQLLQINQYSALYSLLGTQFGGNGTSNFALPDLRGRVPMHFGQGVGLTNRVMGEKAGEESHVLSQTEMPMHSHSLMVNSNVGTSDTPVSNYLARNSEGIKQFSTTQNTSNAGVNPTGNGYAHNNMQPYLTLNFVISLSGIYPTRP